MDVTDVWLQYLVPVQPLVPANVFRIQKLHSVFWLQFASLTGQPIKKKETYV